MYSSKAFLGQDKKDRLDDTANGFSIIFIIGRMMKNLRRISLKPPKRRGRVPGQGFPG
jgi:hypothetical protein